MNSKQKRKLKILIAIMLILLTAMISAYLTFFEMRKMRTITKTQVETERIVETRYMLPDQNPNPSIDTIRLAVKNIEQNPELPTGCEITALCIALNYYQPDSIDKVTLSDKYLPQGAIGGVSPETCFLGDPKTTEGLGCHAPVIVQAANNYFNDQGLDDYTVYDLTGTPFVNLFQEVANGNPVLMWTAGGTEATQEYQWEINGENVSFLNNEHCRVLVGYDMTEGTLTFCDPKSPDNYPTGKASEVQEPYENLGGQAVVIHKIKDLNQ